MSSVRGTRDEGRDGGAGDIGVAQPGAAATELVPPLASWALEDAEWNAAGELESRPSQFGYLLVSPTFRFQRQRSVRGYEMRLRVVLPDGGGLSFGVQDAKGKAWLAQESIQGAGALELQLRVPAERRRACRLVLANWRQDEPAATRIRSLELAVRPIDSNSAPSERRSSSLKDEIRRQWNTDHCGADRGGKSTEGTLEWFRRIERDRYESYAPWMPAAIDFSRFAGKHVLEIGGGIGTDHAQFAKAGARTVDFDLAAGHLVMARRNFEVRGLLSEFVLGDAEELPFADGSFDAVYSFGVIHHSPDTQKIVDHIHRVLRPGGEAIVMVYAKHSWNYWYKDVYQLAWKRGMRKVMSMEEILSAYTEHSPSSAPPRQGVHGAAVPEDVRKVLASPRPEIPVHSRRGQTLDAAPRVRSRLGAARGLESARHCSEVTRGEKAARGCGRRRCV